MGMASGIAGALVGVSLACAAGIVEANDSSAVLGTDGLQLQQSDSVVMESEDLRIGRDEIRVRYVFRNAGQTPVETLVAFPLPEINLAELTEVPVDQPSEDPVNFVDFRVTVDGQPVQTEVEQRAYLQGTATDVTEILQGHGVPLTFFADGFYDTLNALDRAAKDDLTRRQLAVFEEWGVYPQWSTETVFFWPQVFPPGEAVVIEHSYKPVVGQSFFGQYSLDEGEGEHNRTTFCIDEGTEKAIRKKLDKLATTPDQMGYLIAYWTKYILKTGSNWKGPIGRFHLTVDKGKPTALVSFCAEGVTKTGPTTFEVDKTDYTPDRDLDILILEEPETVEPQ